MRRVETQVVTTPGLEPVTAAELTRLGIRVGRTGRGGLSCDMTFPQLALANLQLRTATRVLVRMRRFRAERFEHVTNGVAAVAWDEYLAPGTAVAVRVSASGSRLFHTGAIEEAVREGLPERAVVAEDPDLAARDGAIVNVRVSHDTATVSIDASGVPLYKRGWRTHVGEAPLRETLAAALVLWSGWDAKAPLLDPCCGAGTIVVEAATWARRIAPGAGRSFAFERWPSADLSAVARIRAGADADVLPRVKTTITGRDIDPDVVEVARENAGRAGVSADVTIEHGAVGSWAGPPAFVVTNPPYGVRLHADLPAVYGAIAAASSRLAAVVPASAGTAWIGRPVTDRLITSNGGLDVAFVRA